MAGLVNIGSSSEWSSLLSGTTVVIADFYADWCGPCKMIAPHFEKLAKEHSVPKKLAFAKVNVDNQGDVARTNGVSAMPTFKVFHNGTCVDTIKGANPSALSAAVTKAKSLSGSGSGGGAAGSDQLFKTPGRTLGGPAAAKRGSGSGFSLTQSVRGMFDCIVRFFALYFVSLLSLDGYGSASRSQFNIHNKSGPRGAKIHRVPLGGTKDLPIVRPSPGCG